MGLILNNFALDLVKHIYKKIRMEFYTGNRLNQGFYVAKALGVGITCIPSAKADGNG